jgi:hypothetical protein
VDIRDLIKESMSPLDILKYAAFQYVRVTHTVYLSSRSDPNLFIEYYIYYFI